MITFLLYTANYQMFVTHMYRKLMGNWSGGKTQHQLPLIRLFRRITCKQAKIREGLIIIFCCLVIFTICISFNTSDQFTKKIRNSF